MACGSPGGQSFKWPFSLRTLVQQRNPSIVRVSHPTKKPTAEWMSYAEVKDAVNKNPDPQNKKQWTFDNVQGLRFEE